MRECAMAESGRSVDIVRISPFLVGFPHRPTEEGTAAVQEIAFRTGHLCVAADPALCPPSQERLDRQLALLPRVYGELEVALVSAPDSGDRVTGTARPGIPLNGPAVEARADIRGILTSSADPVVEGRTVRLPLRTVRALADFPTSRSSPGSRFQVPVFPAFRADALSTPEPDRDRLERSA